MQKLSIVGAVRVPEDIPNLVQNQGDAELIMTPNYEFHRNEKGYTTRALLNVDGTKYFITQNTKDQSLSIGYLEKEPDKKTRRKIKKIVDAKFFWDNRP